MDRVKDEDSSFRLPQIQYSNDLLIHFIVRSPSTVSFTRTLHLPTEGSGRETEDPTRGGLGVSRFRPTKSHQIRPHIVDLRCKDLANLSFGLYSLANLTEYVFCYKRPPIDDVILKNWRVFSLTFLPVSDSKDTVLVLSVADAENLLRLIQRCWFSTTLLIDLININPGLHITFYLLLSDRRTVTLTRWYR